MRIGPAAAFLLLTLLPGRAVALDKQGSAHGGSVGDDEDSTAFDVTGSVMLGSALYNPAYAARPDNTGLALFRYAAHADIDLIGRRLSLPLDVNMFTDRQRDGAGVVAPSEVDVIAGVTTTWPVGKTAVEGGVRVEHDAPADRPGSSQTYIDARARWLLSLAAVEPRVGRTLAGGDLAGWLTLGWFVVNPTYFARPDNTGRALLRYAAHVELSTWNGHLAFGVDATLFTDRQTNAIRPSELDLTPEVIARFADRYEIHLAYERDMPIDRGGLVQHFVYALFAAGFELRRDVLHAHAAPTQR